MPIVSPGCLDLGAIGYKSEVPRSPLWAQDFARATFRMQGQSGLDFDQLVIKDCDKNPEDLPEGCSAQNKECRKGHDATTFAPKMAVSPRLCLQTPILVVLQACTGDLYRVFIMPTPWIIIYLPFQSFSLLWQRWGEGSKWH